MIQGFTWASAHKLGGVLESRYRMRYRVFVERQGYEVSHSDGMEYDPFDTPAAVYLEWRDVFGEVRRKFGIDGPIPSVTGDDTEALPAGADKRVA